MIRKELLSTDKQALGTTFKLKCPAKQAIIVHNLNVTIIDDAESVMNNGYCKDSFTASIKSNCNGLDTCRYTMHESVSNDCNFNPWLLNVLYTCTHDIEG